MSAFLLAIKKIIAVLTAIFIPASTAAPAIPQHARVVRVSVFDNVEIIDNSQMEITEDEEGINPLIEDEDNNENPIQEPEQIADNDAPQEELAPVETWDVSATEDDNVTMSFYATEDTEALLNQLAGRITALFTPMTAYAAEYENPDHKVIYDDEDRPTSITDGNTTIDIYHEDMDIVGDGEFGSGAGEARGITYPEGTVVVSGDGNMMDYVYNYFIDVDLYVMTIEELFYRVYGIDVEVDYDPSITDIIELEQNIVYTDNATGEEVCVDERMVEELVPADMLKYHPTNIIIANGVTNISDYAFAMCSEIESVTISEGVTSIGRGAFLYCDQLTTVELPTTLETINSDAFACCTSLDNIVLPSNINWIDAYAFDGIANNATIIIPNEKVNHEFLRYHSEADYNVVRNYN